VNGRLLPPAARRAWIEFVVRPRLWQKCAMFLVAAPSVYLLERAIDRIVVMRGQWAIWWPINGIMVAALLVARRRHWPWMLAGFAVGLGASERLYSPASFYLVDPISNTLELLLPAIVLPRFRSMDRWLAQPGIAKRFTLVAMLAAPTAFALVAPSYTPPVPGCSYWFFAREYGAADMLGFAMFTPLLLALLSRETWELFRPVALPKTIGLIGLFNGVSWLVFHQDIYQAAFVVYPLVLAIGTELGLSGSILAIDSLAVISTLATCAGEGPFGRQVVSPVIGVMELRVFLGLAVTMSLPVAAARVRRLTTEAKLKRAWESMEALATRDGLTGVANRRQFDFVLDREWRRAVRGRLPVSLLMIDADRFKAYNDNYGHLAGDACLKAIASAVAGAVRRPGDLLARYGGEEFAVLLPGTEEAGAAMVAERARRAVHDLALAHYFNDEKRVTVSIGLSSLVPQEGMDQRTLIDRSDRALYEAKHNGRNRVYRALDSTCVHVLPIPEAIADFTKSAASTRADLLEDGIGVWNAPETEA
jgi:diguanylate cyclase (GGDEF)-like protein